MGTDIRGDASLDEVERGEGGSLFYEFAWTLLEYQYEILFMAFVITVYVTIRSFFFDSETLPERCLAVFSAALFFLIGMVRMLIGRW